MQHTWNLSHSVHLKVPSNSTFGFSMEFKAEKNHKIISFYFYSLNLKFLLLSESFFNTHDYEVIGTWLKTKILAFWFQQIFQAQITKKSTRQGNSGRALLEVLLIANQHRMSLYFSRLLSLFIVSYHPLQLLVAFVLDLLPLSLRIGISLIEARSPR